MLEIENTSGYLHHTKLANLLSVMASLARYLGLLSNVHRGLSYLQKQAYTHE